jgi:CubicO group peptidase (beta-lactamase class C family)
MRAALRIVPIIILFAAGCKPVDNAAPAEDVEARIGRVISGLQGPVQIQGEPPAAMTLADRMAHHQVPGVSVAVIDSGRIVWARGFGVKETGSADSVTAETLFQAASISKPVAATAMLRLVQEGRLSLDENVNSYLKSWQLPDNAFTAAEKVTLRRLASHSAGLTVHGFPGYHADSAVPTVVQVLDGARPANTAAVRADTVPGSLWRYSGGGTTLMQLVLTDATGQPFAELMQQTVLAPAGMSQSTYEQPLPEARAAEAARGHRRDGSILPGRWHTYPEQAAAGLWTTPADLARWALAIDAARRGDAGAILSQATATEMLTIQKGTVGLGPFIEGKGAELHFGHGGANEGFRATVIFFPGTGQGAAVMSNNDTGADLNQEILYAIGAEYDWPGYGPKSVAVVTLDSLTLAKIVGEYTLTYQKESIPLTVSQSGGRLVMASPALGDVPDTVLATSPTSFISPARGMQFGFTIFETSVATGVTVTLAPGFTVVGKRK